MVERPEAQSEVERLEAQLKELEARFEQVTRERATLEQTVEWLREKLSDAQKRVSYYWERAGGACFPG